MDDNTIVEYTIVYRYTVLRDSWGNVKKRYLSLVPVDISEAEKILESGETFKLSDENGDFFFITKVGK